VSPAREAAVTAAGVTLRLGTRDIVRDVSFTAHHGEVLCIAGRNGAGKTTLLRAIAGLGPFTGQLQVGGVSASAPAHLRAREVAYVPQRSSLSAALPVARVVEQGRHVYRDALGRLGAAKTASRSTRRSSRRARARCGRGRSRR
jgi:iron complex transport system ATP-binding protein